VSKSARNTISGTIRIRVKVAVDAAGNVEQATFLTEGPSKYFARQAMQAAQQWKFAPPQVNGQAAASAWVLRFGFRKSGTEIDSEPAKP
jgi:TonB family protein